MTITQTLVLVSWLAIGILTLALAGLIRQVRLLTAAVERRNHGFEFIASPESVLEEHQSARLLLFMSPDCRACLNVIDEINSHPAGLPASLPVDVEVAAVFRSGVPQHIALPTRVRTLEGQEPLFALFDVRITPLAVLYTRENGVIARVPISSGQQVVLLADRMRQLERVEEMEPAMNGKG